MFSIGKRKVITHGESFMIAIPMQWLKSVNPEMKTVVIEMYNEYRLRIIAGDTLQDTTPIDHIHSDEYQ
jgi:hypothetical protein